MNLVDVAIVVVIGLGVLILLLMVRPEGLFTFVLRKA